MLDTKATLISVVALLSVAVGGAFILGSLGHTEGYEKKKARKKKNRQSISVSEPLSPPPLSPSSSSSTNSFPPSTSAGSPFGDGSSNVADPGKDDRQLSDAEKQKLLGNEFYKHRDFERAIEHYSKAILLDPTNHVYLLNRAAAFLESGNGDRCIQDCAYVVKEQKSVPLDQQDRNLIAKAHSRIGTACLKLGHFLEAVAAFDASLKEADSADTRRKLGEAKKKLETASKALEKMTTIPESVMQAFEVGLVKTRDLMASGGCSLEEGVATMARGLLQLSEPMQGLERMSRLLPEALLLKVLEELNKDDYFKTFPPLALGLEVRPSGETGRGLFARRAFVKGESVLSEQPFAAVVDHRIVEEADFCNHCIRSLRTKTGTNGNRKLPATVVCPHCGEQTYCSEECRTEAWDKYHANLCVRKEERESLLQANQDAPFYKLLKRVKETGRPPFPMLLLKVLGRVNSQGPKATSIWEHIDHLFTVELPPAFLDVLNDDRKLAVQVFERETPNVEDFLSRQRYGVLIARIMLNSLRVSTLRLSPQPPPAVALSSLTHAESEVVPPSEDQPSEPTHVGEQEEVFSESVSHPSAEAEAVPIPIPIPIPIPSNDTVSEYTPRPIPHLDMQAPSDHSDQLPSSSSQPEPQPSPFASTSSLHAEEPDSSPAPAPAPSNEPIPPHTDINPPAPTPKSFNSLLPSASVPIDSTPAEANPLQTHSSHTDPMHAPALSLSEEVAALISEIVRSVESATAVPNASIQQAPPTTIFPSPPSVSESVSVASESGPMQSVLSTDGIPVKSWGTSNFSKEDGIVATGMALYLVASYINHSCVPNVGLFNMDGTARLVARALRDIDPGEEILTAYMETEGKTAAERKDFLASSYSFSCTCLACKQGRDL